MQNIIYTIPYMENSIVSLLGSSLRKRTIINCFLVGQTLSMSVEKQYTLGKYTIYPVFGSAPLEWF